MERTYRAVVDAGNTTYVALSSISEADAWEVATVLRDGIRRMRPTDHVEIVEVEPDWPSCSVCRQRPGDDCRHFTVRP